MQLDVVEQQVNIEIGVTDHKMVLPPHEREARAKLEEELGHVCHHLLFDVVLLHILPCGDEVEDRDL